MAHPGRCVFSALVVVLRNLLPVDCIRRTVSCSISPDLGRCVTWPKSVVVGHTQRTTHYGEPSLVVDPRGFNIIRGTRQGSSLSIGLQPRSGLGVENSDCRIDHRRMWRALGRLRASLFSEEYCRRNEQILTTGRSFHRGQKTALHFWEVEVGWHEKSFRFSGAALEIRNVWF